MIISLSGINVLVFGFHGRGGVFTAAYEMYLKCFKFILVFKRITVAGGEADK
jgi:hypothetical protein